MARKTSPELEAKIVEYAKKADDARLRILAEKFNVSVQLVATICKRNNIKRSVKWKWQTARDRRVI